MTNFIVYNIKGKILRTGFCPEHILHLQAGDGEFVMEGIANDVSQKIVDGKIVDKTPEEIEADNPTPPEIPESKRLANITNGQWQNVLKRLEKLENTHG